jgi:hypothetical protein
MILSRQCSECGINRQIEVPDDGYIQWQRGELIQNALPSVNIGDRELLISGICGSCFDEMFPEEDQ